MIIVHINICPICLTNLLTATFFISPTATTLFFTQSLNHPRDCNAHTTHTLLSLRLPSPLKYSLISPSLLFFYIFFFPPPFSFYYSSRPTPPFPLFSYYFQSPSVMAPETNQRETESSSIVIIGLGMVALSFIEKILEYDTAKKYTITAICQEPLGKQDISACF